MKKGIVRRRCQNESGGDLTGSIWKALELGLSLSQKKKIAGNISEIGAVQVYAAESAAKVSQRKQLGTDSDRPRQLFQRRKSA